MSKTSADFSTLATIIWFIPGIVLPMFAGDLGLNISEIVLSGILGGVGAAIGAVVFWFTKEKSKTTKIIAFLTMMVVLIGAVTWWSRAAGPPDVLLTCEICGYQALTKKGEECEVCLIPVTKAFMREEGYTSLPELITNEQIYFFALEEGVTFYEPKIYEDFDVRYRKDANWQPSITTADLDTMQQILEDADLYE